MATIVLSAEAPDDLNSVSLANSVIEDFPYETTDPTVLGNATSHPFLDVEFETAESEARYRESVVDPEKDPLSASNPDSRIPFDPEAVDAFEDEKAAEAVSVVAVDAGLDQDESVTRGGVAETLSAYDPPNDYPDADNDATDAQTTADAGDVS